MKVVRDGDSDKNAGKNASNNNNCDRLVGQPASYLHQQHYIFSKEEEDVEHHNDPETLRKSEVFIVTITF